MLDNIHLSRSAVTFYLKPWGPPVVVVDKAHIVSIDHDSFVHNSAQLVVSIRCDEHLADKVSKLFLIARPMVEILRLERTS